MESQTIHLFGSEVVMKKKIGLVISLIVIVGLIVGGIFLFKSNDTSTKFSLEEEQWIGD